MHYFRCAAVAIGLWYSLISIEVKRFGKAISGNQPWHILCNWLIINQLHTPLMPHHQPFYRHFFAHDEPEQIDASRPAREV